VATIRSRLEDVLGPSGRRRLERIQNAASRDIGGHWPI